MVDRKTGKMLSITFWDTENNLRAQGVQHSGTAQPVMVEIYEVAVQT